jgi:hypothetical protein
LSTVACGPARSGEQRAVPLVTDHAVSVRDHGAAAGEVNGGVVDGRENATALGPTLGYVVAKRARPIENLRLAIDGLAGVGVHEQAGDVDAIEVTRFDGVDQARDLLPVAPREPPMRVTGDLDLQPTALRDADEGFDLAAAQIRVARERQRHGERLVCDRDEVVVLVSKAQYRRDARGFDGATVGELRKSESAYAGVRVEMVDAQHEVLRSSPRLHDAQKCGELGAGVSRGHTCRMHRARYLRAREQQARRSIRLRVHLHQQLTELAP